MSRALEFLHEPRLDTIYQNLFFSQNVKFQYPLTSLLPMDLLNWLGISTALQYNAINAGLLIIIGIVFAVFSVQTLGPIYLAGVRLPVAPLAFVIALRFYPDRLAFQIGQIQILLDLLFLLACLTLLHNRRLLAGCLIGAAAIVKPQFAPFALLALWRKDWRFLVGLLAVTGMAVLLSMRLYGWHNHVDYLSVLAFLSRHGELSHLNQSVDGLLVRFLYDGPSLDVDPAGLIPQSMFPPYIQAVYLAMLLSSIAMIAIPFLIPARPNDRVSGLLGFCTASILFTMASPIAWVHHYGVLLPAYVVALKSIRDRSPNGQAWSALFLLALSFVLTGFALVDPFSPTVPALNILQSHVFVGACIFVGVLLAEQRARSLPISHAAKP